MSDAKCPKCPKCPRCRGRIRSLHPWGQPEESGVGCDACGEMWWIAEDFEFLAWFEPRDRLPTPEEEAAHTARHGEGAGWMANQGAGWHSVDDGAEMEILRGFVGESWRCYPIVGGRPVGWP